MQKVQAVFFTLCLLVSVVHLILSLVGLWKKQFNMGIFGRLMVLIWNLYSENIIQILISGSSTFLNAVRRGGCILAPHLLNLYINAFHPSQDRRSCSPQLSGQPVTYLAFADNLVLLAYTLSGFMKILN